MERAFRVVPPDEVAEIISGVLHVSPRPGPRHANATSILGEELGPPFRRGRGGPGGWVFFFEPELHLGIGPDKLVPDLAGWRRERMAELPDTAAFTSAPDWICEVLSERTEASDREDKMPIYAREGVSHAWLVDPIARTLEVFASRQRDWRTLGTYRDDAKVRAEPFEAFELELALLWRP